ncbi:ABC-type transport auxiliary lipoprotein family protein [Halomonas sp. SpR1]|uniref:PqiC family protein n=1 Tax=Halomonas sp. SpR1 TaxID=3050462 RepID=UPI0027E46F68|nr:ABC-type transport auxiliary lipoprotein family protein [Halomonas sp. SpR1]MDQ7735142.1 ABC-type transport auxiliary lipoprotein family protein [Halomonas sp. SpR1]
MLTWMRCSLLLICLLLSACASSVTPPARYMLPSDPLANTPRQPEGTLIVNSPRLAHYLDVDGIVMQLDDITLNAAREHQWAEGLGRQLERKLRANLAQALPTLRVMRVEGEQPNALTLRLSVDQFQGRFDGVAAASGQWQLLNAAGELLAMENFYTETPLAEDGYPALVRALSNSWEQAAKLIANEIRQGDYFD